VRKKIEAGQHTTRLQIGARMMAKNNLLGDRVRRKITGDRNNQNVLAPWIS
jgi:hypothetical protein